ncbi:hypothetical protein ASG40_12860 [Methylobacterium sp. Leaf399]|uniref:hypothetical protein n=1 Tax=unclassified Methylobacterium TaxID=2615210 RepID=UPI0006F998A4|nr:MULTISPECIES: hypothetical protein [unclassified Methylobacterium]KQP50813.1 hypothetical protein ASF39_11240 [Methylobacterium sp. Leaf108]KQT07794.1 hypothetical protein ASG40_12860 [Methylobacterium sp. Leaf399]
MISYTRPSDLPEPAQRVVAWCLAGWMLVAEPGPRGRRYRLDPPPARRPGQGPAPHKTITPSAAETAIASRFLVGRGDGLFGDAQSWTAA